MNSRRLLACLLVWLTGETGAQHLRWTSQADAISMDPHVATEPLSNSMSEMVYERLFSRDRDARPVPRLAVAIENLAPDRWRVHLRKGVRFHDGSPLTADDVVFSFNRARFSGATFNVYAQAAGIPRRVDDHTVEFTTPVPTPTITEIMTAIFIMNRAWCERHGAAQPQNRRQAETAAENHATRNAMGTGPFVLASREPGVRTVYRRNPDWWGERENLRDGNLESVEHVPLANSATRLAALKSGSVDMVWDPAIQDVIALRRDPEIRVWEGPEIRVVFLGFDQQRDQLLHSNVQGRNPFKDRRVRLALYHAIDSNALQTQVMRGHAIPTVVPLNTGEAFGPPIKQDRPAHDPKLAQRLLGEAGYPDGFSFTLHCTNDRFANDERLCTALAAMWARIGVNVRVEAMSRTLFFPKAWRREVSAFLMSYGGSYDPIFMYRPILRSAGPNGGGDMNYGNAKLDELDALIDRIEVEMDPQLRSSHIRQAVRLVQDEVLIIPIHRQVVLWATRRNVTVVQRPDNNFVPIWARIEGHSDPGSRRGPPGER